MLHLPPLYPITDATLAEPLSAQIRRLGEAGYPLVQFRGKPLDAQAQWAELRKALAEAAANGGWPFICVNDRADLALLAAREGLAPWGLHLGQEDLPAAEARRLPGLEKAHLGTSTHQAGEWNLVDPACDHAGVGPFRGTATKTDHATPIGLEGLRSGCAALRRQGRAPIAIGGLALADASACFEAGAESLAMVGEVHRSADPASLGWELQRLRWRARPPFERGQGLALIGGSGAGKTTFGRQLAWALGLPFHDLDAAIEEQEGRPVAEIFATSGEAAFRNLETERLPALMARPGVVALGGGAWEAPANRAAVAGAGFAPLWLAVPPQQAWERASRDPNRPLARDRAAFMARWAARMPAWSLAPMVLSFGHSSRDLVSALLD
ncbi:MAG: thiamine phosphate synthase [Acidobacteria bacterium]|nr:thiamine phosphate synthase [Acidobacteriota bacterium]MBI3488793.1 thiamine phosphate synthase [Acidobacteriota bacterium]